MNWLIKELTITEMPEEVKRKLAWAIAQAYTLGELFLGVVVVRDDKEYIVMDKKDFESWYGR